MTTQFQSAATKIKPTNKSTDRFLKWLFKFVGVKAVSGEIPSHKLYHE